jgi:4-hydroxy-tetrahydrodipicolinate reductase
MIRLGIAGITGRMGRSILTSALHDKRFKVVRTFERSSHPRLGQAIGISSFKLDLADASILKSVDVMVDFTSPQATEAHVAMAQKSSCALVIGTTGLSDSQKRLIKQASKKIPIVLSPNMSIGANLLFHVSEILSRALDSSYDIEILEAHHRHKKDAPSGTAKRLVECIAKAKGWNMAKTAVYGRKGSSLRRSSKEIGIHVIRAGEIVGLHTAMFSGAGETLKVTHEAQSRDAFAQGALSAARFVTRQRKGLFDMFDVLKISSK